MMVIVPNALISQNKNVCMGDLIMMNGDNHVLKYYCKGISN